MQTGRNLRFPQTSKRSFKKAVEFDLTPMLVVLPIEV